MDSQKVNVLHSYSNMHCMKNLCQYNSNTLRPYELAMIEVAVLSLSNPVFMASEISMTCIKMYFGRLMNVYGTDVLLV